MFGKVDENEKKKEKSIYGRDNQPYDIAASATRYYHGYSSDVFPSYVVYFKLCK